MLRKAISRHSGPATGTGLALIPGRHRLSLLLALVACLALLLGGRSAHADAFENLGKIGEITVEGNAHTNEDIVKQTAGLNPGEPLTVERLRWALDNLARRGLWAGQTILTRPGQQAGTTDVRIRVLELPTYLSFFPDATQLIPGYDGLALRDNSVLGGGGALTFRGRWLYARMARLDATEPHVLGTPLFAELTAFYYKKDTQDERIQFQPFALYDERRIGGDIVLGTHLSPNDRVGVDLRIVGEDVWVEFGQVGERHDPLRSVNVFYTRDTRNAIVNAGSGQVMRLAGEFHVGIGGAPPAYQRYSLDMAQFAPLGGDHLLVARLFTGVSQGPVPYYDFWRLGGVQYNDLYEYDSWGNFGLFGSVLRAYQEGAFSGERAINATVEYRFPMFTWQLLGEPIGMGGVFAIDAGNAWRATQALDFGQTRWAVDLGLRVKSPYGTLRIDYGYNPQSQGLFFGTNQIF